MKTSTKLLLGFFVLVTVLLTSSFFLIKKKVDRQDYNLKTTYNLPSPNTENSFSDYKVVKINGVEDLEFNKQASLYYAAHLKKYVLALETGKIQTTIKEDTLFINISNKPMKMHEPGTMYLTHIDDIVGCHISLHYLPPLEKEINPQIRLTLMNSYLNTGFDNYWYISGENNQSMRANEISFKMGDLDLTAKSSEIDFSLTSFSKLDLNLDDQSSLKIIGGFSANELQGKISGGASTKYELPKTERIFKPITEQKTEENDTL